MRGMMYRYETNEEAKSSRKLRVESGEIRSLFSEETQKPTASHWQKLHCSFTLA
jgi:hypothetical protein